MKEILLYLFMTALPIALDAADPSLMYDGKAPLGSVENLKPYTGKLIFDSNSMTYTYGDKQLYFRQDGTFSIFSGGRELAKTYMWIATPFKGQHNINIPRITGKYEAKQMQVRDVKIQGECITVEGLIPWNKPGEKSIAVPWTISITANDKAKFVIRYEYSLPEGVKYIDNGVFMKLTNIRTIDAGSSGRWAYGTRNNIRVNQPSVIAMEGANPADVFKIESGSWNNSHAPDLRFQFNSGKCELMIDLSKSYAREPVKVPGGVDLLAADALNVSGRGKNMLPNPYIADKYQFFEPVNIMNGESVKVCEDAKFGRYSLTGTGIRLAAVPADIGDYVLSYYVKGNGKIWSRIRSVGGGFQKIVTAEVNSPEQWVRREFPFHFTMNNAMVTEIYSEGLKFDGFQLERGRKATAFEAPRIEACSAGDFFFQSGTEVELPFEFSTLEPRISGEGVLTIKNFFGEEVYKKTFHYSAASGKYPKTVFHPGKLQDGIYVIQLDYGKIAPAQYFRFSVMPFLKNTHQTAKAYSLGYYGYVGSLKTINEKYLARLQQIGVGADGHSVPMTKDVLDRYAKYKVIPFDVGYAARRSSDFMKKYFPEIKNIPTGHTWFLVYDADLSNNPQLHPLLPDYRLIGGWNDAYKIKFMKLIADQVRRYPKRHAYAFGSEWAHEIKDDPHYPSLYAAYYEAVKSVYPDALVYEAGEPNMNLDGGIAYYDKLLTRLKGKAKTDFVGIHTYTKNIRELYPNFRAFVDMVNRHKELGKIPIALAEGMHFYPYAVPAWNTEPIAWNGEGWLCGVLSYDLGWAEKISAAYFARAWLTFLTEFDRLWCACSSAWNNNNFCLDHSLAPRALQKIPNTLGILLGNPKRYLGDCTFASDTKCLVWEDEKGHPVAAVWNEDPIVNSGYKDAPSASFAYRGAEYIDLMGVRRYPAKDGEFPVTPFPLFIRGRIGDCDAFVKAISSAVLLDNSSIPCRISFEIKSADMLQATLSNPLAREVKGFLTVFNRRYDFTIPKTGKQFLNIKLSNALLPGRTEKLMIPYVCVVGNTSTESVFTLNCFTIPKFTGDWEKIPAFKLANQVGKKFTPQDLSASCQMAWDAGKLYLRVIVTDDVFAPGSNASFRKNDDLLNVFFDTRCSALQTGTEVCDDDDYEYAFMPAADGKSCDVWRVLSPDIQLTLGIAAPKNNTPAPEIPVKFIRNADGYIYEAEFPAAYLLPAKLVSGSNFAVGIYVSDRDKGKIADHGLSNVGKSGQNGQNQPHLWPVAVLTE